MNVLKREKTLFVCQKWKESTKQSIIIWFSLKKRAKAKNKNRIFENVKEFPMKGLRKPGPSKL